MGSQQLERLRLGLAEVETGVDHDPLAGDAGGLGLFRSIAQNAAHRVDHRLVVDRLWIRGHDGGTGGGRRGR